MGVMQTHDHFLTSLSNTLFILANGYTRSMWTITTGVNDSSLGGRLLHSMPVPQLCSQVVIQHTTCSHSYDFLITEMNARPANETLDDYLTFTAITTMAQLSILSCQSHTLYSWCCHWSLNGGVVVVLGSLESKVEGQAWSGVASLPAGRVIDTSCVVHIDLV